MSRLACVLMASSAVLHRALIRAPAKTASAARRIARTRRRPCLGASTLTRSSTTRVELEEGPARSIDVYATLPSVDVRQLDETYGGFSRSPHGHVIDLDAGPPTADPFALVRPELIPFSDNMKLLVQSGNAILSDAAAHFFETRHGKRFRPTIVMTLAKALPKVDKSDDVFEKQTRLGQVTEMIHVASLIHDDVLDDADTRRGGDAIHKMYSNKVAVLSGDYLLARASVLLARLRNPEVVVVMARALDSLVSGEIMQIKANGAADKKSAADGDETETVAAGPGKRSWVDRAKAALNLGGVQEADDAKVAARDAREMELYLRKSYYKTASLISDASKSCAMLAGHPGKSDVAAGAEEYGYHLGLAFQIIDDVLDFSQDDEALGKPAGADLSLGLATAPILFAAQDHPELRPLIERRFKGDGDVGYAYNAVRKSRGLELTRQLAYFHAQKAVDAICRVAPDSEARDALISICYVVLSRSK